MILTARTAASGGVASAVGQIVRILSQVASLIILSRLLTPRDFGIAAMVMSIVGVADILRDFGLSTAAVQAKHLSDGHRTNLFWANAGVGLLASLVVAAAAPAVSALYNRGELLTFTLSIAPVFLLNGLAAQHRSDLLRQFQFVRSVLVDTLAQLFGLAVAVIAAFSGAGYFAIAVQQLAVGLSSLFMLVIVNPWRPGWPVKDASIRPMASFGFNLSASQMLTFVTNNIDNVLIGIVYGPQALGIYSRAYQLLTLPISQVNAAMTRVVHPVLSRIQDDEARLVRYLRAFNLVLVWVSFSALAIGASLAKPLVRVVLGHGWNGVADIFIVLAVGGIFQTARQSAYWLYLARGRTAKELRFALISRPVVILLITLGVLVGVEAVAWGYALGMALLWPWGMWQAGRDCSINLRPLVGDTLRVMTWLACFTGILVGANLRIQSMSAVAQLLCGTALSLLLVALTYLGSPTLRHDVHAIYRSFRGQSSTPPVVRSGASIEE